MASQVSASLVRSVVAGLLFVGLSNSSVASAAEMVTVKLQSGRRFTAEVSPRTDAQRLWLHFRAEGVSLWRPIDWDRVVEARHEDQILSADELRVLAAGLIADAPLEPDAIVPPAARSNAPPTTNEIRAPAAPVRSVDFYARIANWDADATADGLLLNVFPLDTDGNAVAVTGTLDVNLIGFRVKDFSIASQSRGFVMDRLGHWTQRIAPADLQSSGIRVKLPLQFAQPEFHSQVGTYGIVQVRLVVPGQGVFENSQDSVRIRSFTPTHDLRELQLNRRVSIPIR